MSEIVFSSFKVDQWPKCDRELWEAARVKGDGWEDEGLACNWRPKTIVNVEYHYGTFLWWLQTKGRLDPMARPLDRATPTNIKDFITEYEAGHALSSVSAVVGVIGDMVRVTSPDDHAPWIKALSRRLKRRAEPIKPAAQRKRPLVDLMQVAAGLQDMGSQIISENPEVGALMYRDGLMIAMEVALPLRRSNLAGLQLGRTMIRDDGYYRVQFSGSETKNGRDLHGVYPVDLTGPIEFYLARILPILLEGGGSIDDGWFWIGRRGEPMLAATISARLREVTRKHLGVALAAHSFRHSAMTDIALHDPKHVGIGKSVLGHSSPLASRYYDLASGFEAATRYQHLMRRIRREDAESEGA